MDEQVGKEQDGRETAGQPPATAGGRAEAEGFRQAGPGGSRTEVRRAGAAMEGEAPAGAEDAAKAEGARQAESRSGTGTAAPEPAREDAAGAPERAGQPAARPKSRKKVLTGRVVSNKMDKTAVVLITRRKLHRLYKKTIIESKKIKVHDVKNDCQIGDTVRVVECRPMSKDKHWRLLEIVERAK